MIALVGNAQRFFQMPGDGFAFAVQVGRQINVFAFPGELFQLADDFALPAFFDDDVFRHKGFEVDPDPFFRQIAHMAHAGFDDVIIT